MKDNALIIHPRDNVAVVLRTMAAGDLVQVEGAHAFRTLDDIPASHKVALREISAGEEIIKYGQTVAVSKVTIKKGQWVHTHNLESARWKND